MARAFLSHSTDDKPYVDQVAHKLSRSRIVYDRQSFQPGEDFRDSIRKGLDQSEVFVLFASARSLASTWVKFEIDEAEIRQVAGQLKSILVVIIDPSVRVVDLPAWMQKWLFLQTMRPTHCARHILSKLMQCEGSDRQPLFVGREEVLKEVASQLPPPGGIRTPQVLVFSGLDGVGRRSVAKRALLDNLSLAFGPICLLEETDDLSKLYLQLLEDGNKLTTRKEYKDALQVFHNTPIPEQANLVAQEIDAIAKENIAIVIVDQGALINETGFFTDGVVALFSAIIRLASEPYIVVIQRRRPPLAQTQGTGIASFSIPPLNSDATRRLFVQTLKAANVYAPDEKIIPEITPYLDGYPPAVQLAVAYAKRYGINALANDKSALVDLKVKTFERLLSKLNLDKLDQLMLRVLGMEPGLSLDVLATILNAPTVDVVQRVTRLMDHSVIVQYSDTFSLAAPMRDSVYREFGIMVPDEYASFAERLKEKYWKNSEKIPSLDAIDATLYTAARAHRHGLNEFSDIVLPSMLLKIANAAYHERDYRAARDFAQRAVDANPQPDKGWIILTKAYIRLAHEGAVDWSQAEAILKILKQRNHRTQHYLSGFLSWKRGDLLGAIQHFKYAEAAGDRGVAVYRDRAHCKYQLGFVDEAQKDINLALQKYPRNSFIVDLAAAIAIRSGNFPEAEAFVKQLEEVEPRRENYHHRLATLYAAKKRFDLALPEAKLAIQRVPPLHELFTNYIDILIELGRYPEALEELKHVESQFKGKAAKDVQIGLRCKLALRQGDWKNAEILYSTLQNKALPVHKYLLSELLTQKSRDETLQIIERNSYKKEAETLLEELASAGAVVSATSIEED